MSDNSAFGFGKFVPGFDFLQSLAKSASQPSTAGSAIPGMSSWVAPTLSVEELDKRIQELKAVQFWLEQNGTALKATIQALEVQKMTLTTLQGMNVNMSELAKAFTARAPEPTASAAPEPKPQAAPEPPAAPQAAARPRRSTKAQANKPDTGATVDPMQWWGSLTQQFQNIASAAMQDVAAQTMQAQTAASTSAARSVPAKGKPAGAALKKPASKTSAARKARASRS
ncbi:MAG: PhaM family polyhydroxyalkanoate granule multifunctional regulatory protein [Limnohabitans sp.]